MRFGIECTNCTDIGIVRIHSLDGNFESLMRCQCKEGSNNGCAIPQWFKEYKNYYRQSPCPLDWFKPPKIAFGPDSKILFREVDNRVDAWRVRKSDAVEFWKRNRSQSLTHSQERNEDEIQGTGTPF